MRRGVAALLALVMVVGMTAMTASGAEPAGNQAASTAAQIRAATARWVDAFNRKDARGIVALYAPDAVLLGTSSAVLRDNPALVAEYFSSLPNLGDAVITVGADRVQLFGDTAIHSGYYTRSAMQDGRLVENPARFTFVYARRDGQWHIVNHHSSALP